PSVLAVAPARRGLLRRQRARSLSRSGWYRPHLNTFVTYAANFYVTQRHGLTVRASIFVEHTMTEGTLCRIDRASSRQNFPKRWRILMRSRSPLASWWVAVGW